MRTKKTNWFDTISRSEKYGIKVFHEGEWVDAGDNDGLFIFDTESECAAKRAELKNKQIPTPAQIEE